MKKHEQLLFIPLLLIVIGCLTNRSLNTNGSVQSAEVELILDSLDQELIAFKENTLIPGIALSIVNEQEVIFEKGYGFADLDKKKPFTINTIQPIASISKTIVGVALMKLVEIGEINLDDEVNSYLPFKIVNPKFPDRSITIRHLATHTSSIGDNYGENGDGYWLIENQPYKKDEIRDDMYEFLEIISKNKPISLEQHVRNTCLQNGKWYKEETYLDHEPSTKYSYSNNGASLAGLIIERVSKMSLEEFTKKHIFEPLNMNNSCWKYDSANKNLLATQYFADSQSNPSQIFYMPRFAYSRYPAGHLITCISDMNSYLMEMIKGYQGKGKILSDESFKLLLNPQLNDSHYGDRYSGEFNGQYDIGVFWGISYEGLRLHDGGEIGVYSFMYFDPDTGFGGLGMINARINSFGNSRDIIRKYQKKLSEAGL